MQLEGSCHCENVKFTCETKTPYPFNRCYCSICRKLNGGGGFAINIMAETETMKIVGERHRIKHKATGKPKLAAEITRHYMDRAGQDKKKNKHI